MCEGAPSPLNLSPTAGGSRAGCHVPFTRGCHPQQQFSIEHGSHCSQHKHNAFIHGSCVLGVLSAQRKHSQHGESPAHSPRGGVPAKALRELLPPVQAHTVLGAVQGQRLSPLGCPELCCSSGSPRYPLLGKTGQTSIRGILGC